MLWNLAYLVMATVNGKATDGLVYDVTSAVGRTNENNQERIIQHRINMKL
jgi:hypothetical protein